MRYPTTFKLVFLCILLFSFHWIDCSRLRASKADAEELRGDASDIGSTQEFLKMDKQNGLPLTPFSHRSAPHTSSPLTASPSYERTDSNVSHVLLSAPTFTGSPLPDPTERTYGHGYLLGKRPWVMSEMKHFFSFCAAGITVRSSRGTRAGWWGETGASGPNVGLDRLWVMEGRAHAVFTDIATKR